MIKALIVDDNLQYIKNILNTTINKFSDIHIEYIATTAKEAINIISNNQIDLMFLDLNLPDENGIYIIDQIKYLNTIKNPYIVIIPEDSKLIEILNKRQISFEVISKFESNNIMYNRIKKIIHEIKYSANEKQIKEFVVSEMSNIGYNWKYKGTLYMLETILYIYQNNNMDLLDNLERNVYKYISYRNGKKINNVKTNIIKTTNAIKNGDNLTPKFVVSNILTKIISNY